ncbi:MAG: hypothetical protein EXQ69_10190 [Acidimicrobiia bacterium]|nr:hypothetical protein [Acidimicrobiia bacterium]
MPPSFVSFLSDYGLADEFVGVCKAVIVGLAPETTIIDVTHEIPVHDVRAGGLALVRAIQYLPAGIVLAVVDPGVGTDRRAIAVQTDSGVLVGPDNGLLAPAVAMIGGASRAVSLTNTEYWLESPGPTFSGRDVMAPAVGYLAAGVDLTDLGDEIDPVSLTPGLVSLPQANDGAILGEVWWVDRFGNCQLNVDPTELGAAGVAQGATVEVRVGDDAKTARMARWVHTYADGAPGELLLLVDSYGLMAIACDKRSAAEELGVKAGQAVTLAFNPTSRPIKVEGSR